MLPVHRLVRNLSPEAKAQFKAELEAAFELQSAPLDPDGMPEVGGATTAVLGLQPGNVVALRPRQAMSLKGMMPAGHSDAYKRLDVSIIQHLIIEKLGNLDKNCSIAYTPNAIEARKLVQNGDFDLAFLMSSMSVATIKTIADSNDRMPGKIYLLLSQTAYRAGHEPPGGKTISGAFWAYRLVAGVVSWLQ